MSRITPYEHIYCKFAKENDAGLYVNARGQAHPFSNLIRIKLIYQIITDTSDTGCALNLRQLIIDSTIDNSANGSENGDNNDNYDDGTATPASLIPHNNSILKYYPLHNYEDREDLWSAWSSVSFSPWDQPFDEIKEYLGEKVAMYFCFVGHICKWYRPLSIAGLLVSVIVAIESAQKGSLNKGMEGSFAVPFFCIFVSFWAQLMIEYWKREETRLSMEWGTTGEFFFVLTFFVVLYLKV
jgi:hypothetical protein